MSEEELISYLKTIDSADTDEIDMYFPNKSNPNFKKIMFYIISGLSQIYKEFSAEDSNDSLYEVLNEIETKINKCINYYNGEDITNGYNREIIFSVTDAKNYYIDNDLKQVPFDYHMKRAFYYLLTGYYDYDNEKVVHYNSNHGKLAGCSKYKHYQTRIYSKRIVDNIFCVFFICTKKDDNDTHLDQIAERRLSNTINNEIEELKVILNDPRKRKKILEENRKKLSELLEKCGLITDEEPIDEFDISAVDSFLLSELMSDYTLMPEKTVDKFSENYFTALSIYEDKGYVDLDDDRAKKADLGKWLDEIIKDIMQGKLDDDKRKAMIDLVSRRKNNDKLKEVSTDNGMITHEIMKDYFFKYQSREKWFDYYLTAKRIFDEKGFVDLEDDEAKKIDLGRWLDLQIDLLINGQLDSVKIDFINELLSSMKTRKEDIYIPELEQQRLKNTLSEKFDYLLKNLSLDDLQEFETTIDNFSSGKKSHKH